MSNLAPPLSDLYAPIRGQLDRVVAIMDDELRSQLPFVDELAQRVKAYRGKMLRPALLLLTADAVRGIQDEHQTLAAVVELVHLATLVTTMFSTKLRCGATSPPSARSPATKPPSCLGIT
jgi:octaprenyl-diphosphate synthase